MLMVITQPVTAHHIGFKAIPVLKLSLVYYCDCHSNTAWVFNHDTAYHKCQHVIHGYSSIVTIIINSTDS